MWVVLYTQGLVHQAHEEVREGIQQESGCGLMPEYALRHLSVQTHPAIQDRYSEFRAKRLHHAYCALDCSGRDCCDRVVIVIVTVTALIVL